MPAKAKVTREMIIDAAFHVVREEGAGNINARILSQRLHCLCSLSCIIFHQ